MGCRRTGASGRLTRPRVVLDTNILVSTRVFRTGTLSWLRHAWQSERIRPLVSHATVGELIRVLAYPKFRLDKDESDELLADYLPWCESVTVAQTPSIPDCRDPGDRIFLELALAGEAEALITGDDDLLTLAREFRVLILTPNAIKMRLN